MKKSINRLDYVDGVKGIGILCVIIGHSSYGGGLPNIILGFYMPLFFLVSGYVFKEKENDSLETILKKKTKQLLIPYIVYMGILWVIYYIRYAIIMDISPDKSIKDMIIITLYSRYSYRPLEMENNIFFLDMDKVFNSPLWFLTCMFVSYIIFLIGIEIAKKYNIKSYIVILSCLLITIIFYQLNILLPWSIDTAFLGAAFILTGYYYKGRIKKIVESKKYMVIFLFLFIYIKLIQYNGSTNMSVRNFGMQKNLSVFCFFLTGFIGTILLLWGCNVMSKIFFMKGIEYIGKYTLPIMAFHLIILNFINPILFNFSFQSMLAQKIICVVIAVIICILIILIYKFVNLMKKKLTKK